jgi:hypothetical protein
LLLPAQEGSSAWSARSRIGPAPGAWPEAVKKRHHPATFRRLCHWKPAGPADDAVDPSVGRWYLRKSNSAGGADAGSFLYGLPGWLPLAGPS